MTSPSIRFASALCFAIFAAGCGDTDPVDPADREDAVAAARIQIVEGSGQYGRTGMFFDDHLTVFVTDVRGDPVQDARVEWEVTDGPAYVVHSTSFTNSSGLARATLSAGATLGDVSVRAWPKEAPHLEATFEAKVSAHQIVMKNDEYNPSTVTVSVGDTVEWLNKDMLDRGEDRHEHMTDIGGTTHSATTVRVPPGGNSFDSGMLQFDETYQWAPETTGIYEVKCKVHDPHEWMIGWIEVVR